MLSSSSAKHFNNCFYYSWVTFCYFSSYIPGLVFSFPQLGFVRRQNGVNCGFHLKMEIPHPVMIDNPDGKQSDAPGGGT